jgi:hypothetical protein
MKHEILIMAKDCANTKTLRRGYGRRVRLARAATACENCWPCLSFHSAEVLDDCALRLQAFIFFGFVVLVGECTWVSSYWKLRG